MSRRRPKQQDGAVEKTIPSDVYKMNAVRQQYEAKIEALQRANDQLREQLETQKQTSMAMAADYKSRFDELKSKVTVLEKAKESVYDSWNEDSKKLNAKYDQLCSESGKRIKKLRGEKTALRLRLSELEGRIAKMSTGVVPEQEVVQDDGRPADQENIGAQTT